MHICMHLGDLTLQIYLQYQSIRGMSVEPGCAQLELAIFQFGVHLRSVCEVSLIFCKPG